MVGHKKHPRCPVPLALTIENQSNGGFGGLGVHWLSLDGLSHWDGVLAWPIAEDWALLGLQKLHKVSIPGQF